MQCKCGNKTFVAHQVCHLDVVVDSENEFLRNLHDTSEASIYYSGMPFGPYTCTVCGAEYNELSDLIPEV